MSQKAIVLFLLSFALSFIVLKLLIPFLKRTRAVQYERPEALENHKIKEGTPRGAGLVFLIPLMFLFPFTNWETKFVAFSVFIFALAGLIDDLLSIYKKDSKGLSISHKLILYFCLAIVLFLMFRQNLTFSTIIAGRVVNIPPPVYFALFIVIFVGSANAFNLTDGVDGLLSTVSIPMFLTVVVLSAANSGMALFSFLMIASIIAFLWYNSPKASVFMGDVGANIIGLSLAAMSVVGKFEFLFALIAIIPVIEAITDFIQIGYFKVTNGKRFFKMAPIHHHFEKLGWSEAKITYRFTVVTVIFCLIALLLR